MRGLISHLGFKTSQIFYEREARFDGIENTKYPLFSLVSSMVWKCFYSFFRHTINDWFNHRVDKYSFFLFYF